MKRTLHWRKCFKKKNKTKTKTTNNPKPNQELQNDPQSLGNDLNISTPDTNSKGKKKTTAKSTLYLQKNDLKTLWFFFTNRCRTGISPHFFWFFFSFFLFKNSLHIYL